MKKSLTLYFLHPANYLLLLVICCTSVAAQDYAIQYNSLTILPSDSLEQDKLLSSIDGFLLDMAEKKDSTAYVASSHFKDYSIFFDLLRGYAASGRYKDKQFYKAYLLDATPKGKDGYMLKIALMGIPKEDPIIFRMIFQLLAVEKENHFQFYTLMEENEKKWKHTQVGNIEYVYHGSFNKDRAKQFDTFNASLAQKLEVPPKKIKYYKCKDPSEALAFIGIDFHISYNGEYTGLGRDDGYRFLTGVNEEGYEHDLLHIYFDDVFDASETYRAFEEGIAGFFGGSWGDTYPQIIRQLSDYVDANPQVNLYDAYYGKVKIGIHDIRSMINALLVEELDRKHGFDSLIDVLHCGNDGALYWEKLAKYLPITKDNFTSTIKQLLRS